MCLQHYAAGNKCKIPSLFPGSVVSCSRGRKVQTLETRLSIHFFSPLFLSSAFLLLFFSFFLPSFFPSFVSCFLCPLSQVVSRVLCPVSCFLPYFPYFNRVPFGQHEESRPLARSNDIPVLHGFVNTINRDQNQSDLSDLTLSMRRVTGKP